MLTNLDAPKKLSQTIDYIGSLRRILDDLNTYESLTYELIQNADDVKDELGNPAADRLEFDVCDDALIVYNNGVFLAKDFTRMRTISAGGKRDEANTTGKFGIGFISVYQITDRPEIRSSGLRWVIDPTQPESDRIDEWDKQATEGTQFKLPWALDAQSEFRKKLGRRAIDPLQFDEITRQIIQAAETAAPFLKQLTSITIKRNGQVETQIQRLEKSATELTIKKGDNETSWYLLRDDFVVEAAYLKHKYDLQENRHANVTLAICQSQENNGVLYATLPTQDKTLLPFHINADFYLNSERKHVRFDSEAHGAWNKAIVETAAKILSQNLIDLRLKVEAKNFWHLLRSIKKNFDDSKQKNLEDWYQSFWWYLRSKLAAEAIIYTSLGVWVKPSEVRLLENDVTAAQQCFSDLGFQIVHDDLREFYVFMRINEINAPILTLKHVIENLEKSGFTQEIGFESAPQFMRDESRYDSFLSALNALKEKALKEDVDKLKKLALGLSQDFFRPLQTLRLAKGNSREAFNYFWLEERLVDNPILSDLIARFNIEDAIGQLEDLAPQISPHDWHPYKFSLELMLRWIIEEVANPKTFLSPDKKTRLKKLCVWPTTKQLYPLTSLQLPSGFNDPLGIALVFDDSVFDVPNLGKFLKEHLGVTELNFLSYVKNYLISAIEANNEVLNKKAVNLLAKHLKPEDKKDELKEKLCSLKIIECHDGKFYPAKEVYEQNETTKLLKHVNINIHFAKPYDHLSELYRWLGLSKAPRPEDLLREIEKCRELNDFHHIKEIFEYLQKEYDARLRRTPPTSFSEFDLLKSRKWLRSLQNTWESPQDLYTDELRHLFESQAKFLAFPAPPSFLDYLGVKKQPEILRVIKHLIYCIENNRKIDERIYHFLNESDVTDQELFLLKDKAWIFFDNRYFRSDQVFWQNASLGKWRSNLPSGFRAYTELFRRLGVKESPNTQDFIKVILEISDEYEKSRLTEDTDNNPKNVIQFCWKELGKALFVGALEKTDLDALKDKRVVLNKQDTLQKPERILIEDKADLAKKWKVFLENNTITPPPDLMDILEFVGVQKLSQRVDTRPMFEGKPMQITSLRLTDYYTPILRIIDAMQNLDDKKIVEIYKNVNHLNILRVGNLKVRYQLTFLGQRHDTPPEVAHAFLSKQEKVLYISYSKEPDFTAIARELGGYLVSSNDAINIVPALKTILEVGAEYANIELDEMGYRPHDPSWGNLPSTPNNDVNEKTVDFVHTDQQSQTNENISEEIIEPPSYQSSQHVHQSSITDSTSELKHTAPISSQTKTQPINAQDAKDETISLSPSEKTNYATPTNVSNPVLKVLEDFNASRNRARSDSDLTNKIDFSTRESKQSGDPKPRSNSNSSRSRLRSYVEPDIKNVNSETNHEDSASRVCVGEAGIKHVLRFERRQGRNPTEMPHNNPGFDIHSRENNTDDRFIEVKSFSGEWSPSSPAALTPREFKTAQEKRDLFWLYIVEYAESDQAEIWCIQDPFNQIDQFMFDNGWKAVATRYFLN